MKTIVTIKIKTDLPLANFSQVFSFIEDLQSGKIIEFENVSVDRINDSTQEASAIGMGNAVFSGCKLNPVLHDETDVMVNP
jgi:hypothetical protein